MGPSLNPLISFWQRTERQAIPAVILASFAGAVVFSVPERPSRSVILHCAYLYSRLETRADTNALDKDAEALRPYVLDSTMTCGRIRRSTRMEYMRPGAPAPTEPEREVPWPAFRTGAAS